MHSARKRIHIVADFITPGGGREHARALRKLLTPFAEITCWSEEVVSGDLLKECRTIRPFSGDYPDRGTLLIIGPQRRLSPWAEHSRAERVILVCNSSEPAMLFRQIAYLRSSNLPEVEVSFVSKRLKDTMGIPGTVNMSPIEVENYPQACGNSLPVIGRHSRDTPGKHHPHDPSLYRQLALRGMNIRVLGGTCLAPELNPIPEGISLLPFGKQSPSDFLSGLDLFFYRTGTGWAEPSGRVVLEALACGLPVIADTSGGYTDWIMPGENGYLVTSQDEAFECIVELASDVERRKIFGAAARQTALCLSGENARDEITRWYLEGA